MPMVKQRSLALVKEEAAYGIDPTPTPVANAIQVEDPVVKPVPELLTRNYSRPSFSPLPHVVGMKHVQVTFKTELKGSGSADAGGAGDVPEIDPLLLACGMAKTLTAESSGGAGDGDVTYDPASTALKSCTIWIYKGEVLHKIVGCVGSFKINAEAGKLGSIEWTFFGLYAKPTDAVIPAGAVFNAEVPPPFINANFSISGYAAIIANLEIDVANKVSKRVSANAAQGVVGFLITDRESKGSIDPEAVDIATHDFWGEFEGGTQVALAATIGAVAGARIDFTAPKVQYEDISWQDREDTRTYGLPMNFAQNAGDDELKIKFY